MRVNAMPSVRPLRRISLPVANSNDDAGDQQCPEQRQKQKAPRSDRQIVVSRRGDELPDVGERIARHGRLPRTLAIVDFKGSRLRKISGSLSKADEDEQTKAITFPTCRQCDVLVRR